LTILVLDNPVVIIFTMVTFLVNERGLLCWRSS